MFKIKISVFNLWSAFIDIIRATLPQDRDEKRVFVFAFAFYLFLGCFWLFHVNLDKGFTLLGYDTYEYTIGEFLVPYKVLFFKLRHPLMAFWLFPVSVIAYLPEWLLGIASVLPVFTVATNLAMALSTSLVWRICRFVNPSSINGNLICTGVYFSFAQVIILSFAVESFPFSSLALLSYISYVCLLPKKTDIYSNNLFFAIVSGITITNGLKFVLAQLLWKEKCLDFVKRTFKSSFLFFFLTSIAVLVAVARWVFLIRPVSPDVSLISLLLGDSMNYVMHYDFVQRLKVAGYNFFVSPILLCVDALNFEGFDFSEKVLSNLSIWVIPLCVFYSGLLLSLWINRKKQLVSVFLCFLAVDVLIHLILGYGLNEGHIFSGHWLFMFPILLAMLSNFFKNSIIRNIYYLCLFIFGGFLFVHNISYIVTGIVNIN